MFQEGVEKAVDKLVLFSRKNLAQNFLTEIRVLHIKCATIFYLFLLNQLLNWIELELSQGVNAMSRNPEAATPSRKDLLSGFGRSSSEASKGGKPKPTCFGKWGTVEPDREENRFSSESREHTSGRDVAGNFHFDGILEREKSGWKGRPAFWVVSYALRSVAGGLGVWVNHLRS